MQDRTLIFITPRKSDFIPCDFIQRELLYAQTSLNQYLHMYIEYVKTYV